MAQPLISVIVPVYNGEAYIARLVDMLKKQVYQNLEIIIVNDGSTDNTQALCETAAQQDARFHIFCKENGGASSARNYGMAKATGEYIGFVDADDYIYPEYFSYLYDLIQKYDADMACCNYYKMNANEKAREFPPSETVYPLNQSDALKHVWYRKYITGYPYLKLYKREVLKGIRFPENIVYGEDFLFTVDAVSRCGSVIYGDRILYIYYQNKISATHSSRLEPYMDTCAALKNRLENYEKEGNMPLAKAARAKCFIYFIDCCCRMWGVKDKSVKEDLLFLLNELRALDYSVLCDGECKKLNRILALLSCISPSMMICCCRLYLRFKSCFGFETRQSV